MTMFDRTQEGYNISDVGRLLWVCTWIYVCVDSYIISVGLCEHEANIIIKAYWNQTIEVMVSVTGHKYNPIIGIGRSGYGDGITNNRKNVVRRDDLYYSWKRMAEIDLIDVIRPTV